MRAIYEQDQTTEPPEEWRSDLSGFDDMQFRIFRDDDNSPGGPTYTNKVPAVSRLRKAVGTNFRGGGPVLRATLANTGRPNMMPKADASERKPEPERAEEPASSVRDVAAIVAEVLRQTGTGGEHRMEHPVRTETAKNASVSDDRAEMTLRAFYEASLASERAKRVATGRNKSGTVQKDLAALSFWERLSGDPALRDLTGETAAAFVSKAIAAGRRSTASGYVGHLRWMLNEAKRAGIVASVPAFTFPKVSRRSGLTEEHRETLIYEIGGDLLGTLGRIHDAIECPELRLAFVCGASFGPRTEDLLTLRWSDFDLTGERPVVRYVAEKTGTFHVVPLAPWLVARLLASQTDQLHVFPTLISHSAAIPAKSRAARRTVANLRAAAASIGFDFTQGGRTTAAEQKPFQILRATCNERFERHHRRAGEWILGHAMNSLNRKSYQNPASEIFTAVLTLPQPQAFLA